MSYKDTKKVKSIFGDVVVEYTDNLGCIPQGMESLFSEPKQSGYVATIRNDKGQIIFFGEGLTRQTAMIDLYTKKATRLALSDLEILTPK